MGIMVILCILFEVLASVCCIHYLYGEKVKLEIKTIVFVIIEIALMVCLNYFKMNLFLSLLIYPMLLLYCRWRFGSGFPTIIINFILYLIIVCSLQATLLLLYDVFFDEMTIIGQLLINISIFLVIIFVMSKCKLNKISRILQEKDKVILLAEGFILVSIFAFLFKFKNDIGFDIFYYVILVLSVFFIYLVILDIGKHKMKAKEVETELRMHKMYEASVQNLIDDIRSRQHEFDNHINAVYNMHLLYDTFEELIDAQKEYCQDIIKENQFNKLLSDGNKVVIGFLYGKLSEIDKKGIHVDFSIAIKEMDCKVPSYKIVEIIGNLLNNATEELLTNQSINKLFVGIHETEENIIIEVSNQVTCIDYDGIAEMFKKGYSKKGERRGYGLYNVKKICDDYNIDLECRYKEENGTWLEFKLKIEKVL